MLKKSRIWHFQEWLIYKNVFILDSKEFNGQIQAFLRNVTHQNILSLYSYANVITVLLTLILITLIILSIILYKFIKNFTKKSGAIKTEISPSIQNAPSIENSPSTENRRLKMVVLTGSVSKAHSYLWHIYEGQLVRVLYNVVIRIR